MPIDPSIPLQARPFTLESPLAQASQAMSLQNMLQQGDMNRLKMQQAQQEQAREQEFRAAIANAKTPEEQLAVASRFMGPEKLGTMIQTSQDKQSRDRATKEMAMARLTQAAQQFEQNYQARLRTVTTQEERLALARQKAAFTQQLQVEAQRLAGAEGQYNFGFMPNAPPQPTVAPGPLSALQPQSAPSATPYQPPGSLAAMLSPQEQAAMSTVREHLNRGQIGSASAANPSVFMPSQVAPQQRPAPMPASPMAAPPGPSLTGSTPIPSSSVLPQRLRDQIEADRLKQANRPDSTKDADKNAKAEAMARYAETLVTRLEGNLKANPSQTTGWVAPLARGLESTVNSVVPGAIGSQATMAKQTKEQLLSVLTSIRGGGAGRLSNQDLARLDTAIGQLNTGTPEAMAQGLKDTRELIKALRWTTSSNPTSPIRASDQDLINKYLTPAIP